jgi:RimJ/RimL family protein N-acetyltransferase
VGELHLETFIAAPVTRCFDLARSVDLHVDSAGATGERAVAGVTQGLLGPGDTVTWEGRHFGVRQRLTAVICAFDPPASFTDRQVSGAFAELVHRHRFQAAGGGTVMHDEVRLRAPLGLLGRLADPVVTGHLRRFIEARNRVLKEIAEGDGWRRYLAGAGVVRTPRLDLVPLDAEALRALLAGDLATAGARIGARIPEGLALKPAALARRLAQLEADPALESWRLRAIVVRETRTVVGRVGFHSAPGPADLAEVAPGAVELGYEIDPRFRRLGHATEATGALMRWARETHGQRDFVLSIAPDNVASQGVAARLGFVKVGTHVDDEDGPEDWYLGRLG